MVEMVILHEFRQLVELNDEKHQLEYIDLSAMIEKFQHCTPISVPCTDSPATFADLPYVILHNFFNNCQSETYPLNALQALLRIVSKSVDDEDAKPQLMLLVHVTELRLSVSMSAMYIQSFENMSIQKKNAQTAAWIEVADKLITHPTLNETINQIIEELFGQEFSKICETETKLIPVSVRFVATTEFDLRGFAGINEIFINSTHFSLEQSKLSLQSTLPNKENVLLMDILTVVIHGYAHIRARQLSNDFNFSTTKAILRTDKETDPELGRIVERALFTIPIDWMRSLKIGAVTADYINQFIEAVNNGNELPRLSASPSLIARFSQTLMHGGIDLCHPERTLE